MADYGTVYREAQGRVMSLVNNQNAATPLPACPDWTVKDVVAHLTGTVDDIRTGRIEGAFGDEWNAAQVEHRKHRSLAEILTEWQLLAHTHPRVLIGEQSRIMVVDLICHEFDIRGAIGNREARYLLNVRSAALFFLEGLDHYFREEGVPALEIRVEDKVFAIGQGEPAGAVDLTWFEALRTVSGRRSRAQVAALPWKGNPEIWLDHLFILGPAEHDIAE